MKQLNEFQKEFMEMLATVQDTNVQVALCQKYDKESLEDILYDVTSNIIIDILVQIDGYGNSNMGRLDVTCKKTGMSLKDSPYIELHDVVCEFLKGIG